MARKKNIQKLAEVLNSCPDRFSDGSASWVRVESNDYAIDFVFDGKGEVLEDIKLSKKEWAVINEEVISKIIFKTKK